MVCWETHQSNSKINIKEPRPKNSWEESYKRFVPLAIKIYYKAIIINVIYWIRPQKALSIKERLIKLITWKLRMSKRTP